MARPIETSFWLLHTINCGKSTCQFLSKYIFFLELHYFYIKLYFENFLFSITWQCLDLKASFACRQRTSDHWISAKSSLSRNGYIYKNIVAIKCYLLISSYTNFLLQWWRKAINVNNLSPDYVTSPLRFQIRYFLCRYGLVWCFNIVASRRYGSCVSLSSLLQNVHRLHNGCPSSYPTQKGDIGGTMCWSDRYASAQPAIHFKSVDITRCYWARGNIN